MSTKIMQWMRQKMHPFVQLRMRWELSRKPSMSRNEYPGRMRQTIVPKRWTMIDYPEIWRLHAEHDRKRREERRYNLDQQFGIYLAAKNAVIAMLRGAILHIDGLTAGNGRLIDWRTVKSGEILLDEAPATEVAIAAIEKRGTWRLQQAVDRWMDGERSDD